MANERTGGLWDELEEAYETYKLHSFTKNPPEKPLIDHWQAQGPRLARIYLGMPSLPVMLFRVRNYLVRRGVPLLPYLCELLSSAVWHVVIGRYVVIGPGLVIAHGYVVIDGDVRIGRNCVINPWVTVGLSGSRRWGFDSRGPVIGDEVFIGTGAKVLGPITIGDRVRIGANAVVVDDVPPGATVVGAPGRVAHDAPPAWIVSS
jgi:serine O-acetyltransferase